MIVPPECSSNVRIDTTTLWQRRARRFPSVVALFVVTRGTTPVATGARSP